MPTTHRPDVSALRKEPRLWGPGGTKYKSEYLWPYINVEDLVQAKSLLLFINSRGRHPPCMFAQADFEASNLGRVSGAITLPFLNMYTMFLHGQEPKTYGKIEAWSDNEDAFEMMMTGQGSQPGEGLLILEIQQNIYTFLVACCQSILHDLYIGSLTGEDVPIYPEASPISGNPAEWPTMASIAAEAPYHLPANLNFGRLKAVISAKRSAAEDHIWALREDPGYFFEVLGDWREHRQELLLDTNGRSHPILKNIKPLLWELVIGNVVTDAYGALLTWDMLCRDLTALEDLQAKYSKDISAEKSLPQEYMKALVGFGYSLDQISKGPIYNLKTGVLASPPLRSSFVREPQMPGSTMIHVKSKTGLTSDPMRWLLQTLWDEKKLFLCGLPHLMDEIERMIENDPKQKEKFSPWVARVFSDLGLLARAKHEIDNYQPWAAGLMHAYGEYQEQINTKFAEKFSILQKMDSSFKNMSLAKVGAPTDGRFQYPSDKRRTQQVTGKMQQSEQNLDLFWGTVDQKYKTKTGKTLQDAFQPFFTKERQLEWTPDWIEPIKERTKKPDSGDSEFDNILAQLRVTSKNSSIVETTKSKSKVKTKGLAQPTEADSSQAPPPEPKQAIISTPDIQPSIPVTKRGLKVFSTLFHSPSQPDQPGEIPWPDFLHVMASAGFMPLKLYGSVWQFTPTALDMERSIQFHEPHPRGKIPFRSARLIGRRLNRAYGWHGGMFVTE